MSFRKFVAMEVLLFLFVAVTMPLWLPFWIVIALKDWYKDCRYTWECMELNRLHDERIKRGQAGEG